MRRRERTLLILDGLEPLQFPPGPQTGRLKDPGMIALLKELAAHNPGLCVCTSRLPLTDLEDYGNAGLVSMDLENLRPESGGRYLGELGVKGIEAELRQASIDFGNHALALTLLGYFLVKRRGGDVRKRDTLPPLFDEPKKGGHARRMYRQYEALFKGTPELDVLRIMGLFDRPADKGALKILRRMGEDEWAGALETLAEARLVKYDDPEGPLDCHPLLREHFAEEYRESNAGGFREAHAQLYERYSNQAPHQPDTLEQMSPLFHAVFHGCRAQKEQEVFRHVYARRILRGHAGFLYHKLGGLGVNLTLLANFFRARWSEPVPSLSAPYQSWASAEAAFALRAVGRLKESEDPLLAALKGRLSRGEWEMAATSLDNLVELRIATGDVPGAITAARQSVDVADKSGEVFRRIARRAKLADALHQSGDTEGALAIFQEAEKMQAARQPGRPLLYSIQRSWYCDLLLAQGKLEEVRRRAEEGLESVHKDPSLITIALDHLSLGRALTSGSIEATRHMDDSVSGLRQAGMLHHLPRGLLARAAQFRYTGEFFSAQRDLDEVRILASRCGMRLHLADYHLEEAASSCHNKRPETPYRTTNPPNRWSRKPTITAATPNSRN